MFRLRCISGTVRLRQVRVISRRRHIAAQTLQVDKTLSHGEFIHMHCGIDTHKHIQRPLRLFNPQLSLFVAMCPRSRVRLLVRSRYLRLFL